MTPSKTKMMGMHAMPAARRMKLLSTDIHAEAEGTGP
jgi:hypothetical protein